MRTCLYCPNVADTEEHPLPAAFGEFENAPLLNDRICGRCNNTTLGRLDEQLTRSGPEAFMRRFFGIDGRKHHEKINPFYRGSSGGGRLRAKAFDAEVGFEVELEFDGKQVRQSRQIVFIEQSGKIHHLPIPEKLRDPEKLLALYRGLGVTPPVQARIFYDPSESDWVLPLVQAAWPASSFNEMGLGASSFSGAVTEFHVNHRYFRAYAKIGFHYFLTQFPQYDGSEASFADIRDFIGNDTAGNDQVNKFVARREVPLLAQMLYGARPDEWVGHLLCAEIRHGECLAHVQFFLSKFYPAPIYTVRLGHDAAATNTDSHLGHGYSYFEDGPQGKFSGEADPLTTTRVTMGPIELKPAIGQPDTLSSQ